MTSPLLKNAVAAIKLGVSDYKSTEPDRALSAVRNIAAGVLLVFKEKLRQLSPVGSDEVLLKERLVPVRMSDGNISFVGTGRKTVDVQQIKERFKSLGVLVDWKRFNDLVAVRNDLEHYYTTAPHSRVQELLADTFAVLQAFITTELNFEPVELLGDDTWQVLLAEATVYRRQLNLCRSELERISWPSEIYLQVTSSIRCLACGSELIKPIDPTVTELISLQFICTACGELSDFEDVIEDATADAFSADAYIAMTDGGDPPLSQCHECARFTFHMESSTCLVCNGELEFTQSGVCGEGLGPDDQDNGGLCGYHKWQAERDD